MFKNPIGIALDSTGNFIYVADSGNARVEVFSNSIPAILPIPLTISLTGTQAVLRWSNPAFSLQSAPALTGPWTTVSNATSPFTNDISSSQLFFRLKQ
jgi:DNA-binding beta-propeller fold protein YncE